MDKNLWIFQTENNCSPKWETDEIKQELLSSEDENPQIETKSSFIDTFGNKISFAESR